MQALAAVIAFALGEYFRQSGELSLLKKALIKEPNVPDKLATEMYNVFEKMGVYNSEPEG